MRLGPSAGLYVAVAAGGIAGGVLRMLVLAAWPPAPSGLSVALLTVNTAGSGLIGLVLAFSEPAGRHHMPPVLAVGLMAGFCGALTTFSTFSVEMLALAAVDPGRTAGYIFGSLVSWLAAAALGLLAGRRVNRSAQSEPDIR